MNEIEIGTLNGTKWILASASPEPMTWVDAEAWCESIGQELPTRDVLLLAYINPETRSEFANDYYWSSSEDDSYSAWSQSFSSGYQSYLDKDYTLPVRAVRAIKVEKLLAQPEQKQEQENLELVRKLGFEAGYLLAIKECSKTLSAYLV